MNMDAFEDLLKRWRQRGAIITFTAVLLPLLMACTGFAIDIGSLMSYKAKLQNVADAAALAGVARFGGTKFDSVSYRLTKIPSDISNDGSFTITMGETEYKMVEDTSTYIPDSEAEVYVDSNTSSKQKLSLMELKQEDAKTTQMWASKDKNNKVNAVCYLVRLHDTIPTYFMRLFGIEDMTPEVVAVAMAYTEEKKIDDIIPEVVKNIVETIPAYYSESIVGEPFTVTNKEVADFHVRDLETDKDYFGYGRFTYFTEYWKTRKGWTDIIKEEKFDDDQSKIIAYQDPSDGGICAESIYADEGADVSSLTKHVYTLNRALMTKGKDEKEHASEITGLLVDRPSINDSERAKVRGVVLDITGEKLSDDESTPLYIRFESEPTKFGTYPTFVQSTTVNVNGYQKKPLIIAYDGPDPKRTLEDVPKTDVKKPWVAKSNDGSISATERLTSATVSAPYTVNLNADFNGVIYAPFSEITINGNGKINGFIMAGRIIDNGTSTTRTRLISSEVSLPTFDTTFKGYVGSKAQFSYEIKYITGRYSIVYDSLTYYTDRIVYKE